MTKYSVNSAQNQINVWKLVGICPVSGSICTQGEVTTQTLCVLQSQVTRACVQLVTLEPTKEWMLFVRALFSGARCDFEMPAMTITITLIATVENDRVVIICNSISHLSLKQFQIYLYAVELKFQCLPAR